MLVAAASEIRLVAGGTDADLSIPISRQRMTADGTKVAVDWRGPAGTPKIKIYHLSVPPKGAFTMSRDHLRGLIWARRDAAQAHMATINPPTPGDERPA
jgi:hypothetical protein